MKKIVVVILIVIVLTTILLFACEENASNNEDLEYPDLYTMYKQYSLELKASGMGSPDYSSWIKEVLYNVKGFINEAADDNDETVNMIDIKKNSIISYDDAVLLGYSFENINEDEISLKTYRGNKQELIIPAYIKSKTKFYKVTALSSEFVSRNEVIKEVYIPNTVTSLGENAFYDCSSLKTVALACNIIRIPALCFFGCISLNNIVLPQEIKYLDNKCFGCTALINIDLPEGLIEMDCFSDCGQLENIIIPDSVISLGDNCFYKCVSLKSIVIPNNVATMDHSFRECKMLSSVVIGSSVKTMYAAFENCTSLENISYKGTIEEWKTVNKTNVDYHSYSDLRYKHQVPGTIVHCLDGDAAF